MASAPAPICGSTTPSTARSKRWRPQASGYWVKSTSRCRGAPGGLRVLGATNDPEQATLEVRLGEPGHTMPVRLTCHTVDVRAMRVLTGTAAADAGLEIEHQDGLMRLTFLPA